MWDTDSKRELTGRTAVLWQHQLPEGSMIQAYLRPKQRSRLCFCTAFPLHQNPLPPAMNVDIVLPLAMGYRPAVRNTWRKIWGKMFLQTRVKINALITKFLVLQVLKTGLWTETWNYIKLLWETKALLNQTIGYEKRMQYWCKGSMLVVSFLSFL